MEICQTDFILTLVQVSKKEPSELPKTMTITPSESTHFRVILSSEAMEVEAGGLHTSLDPGCGPAIVKPEPRTPKQNTLLSSKHHPPDPLSEPHHPPKPIHDHCPPQPEPCPLKPEPGALMSEPSPDLCIPSKPERRGPWTSTPPSVLDSSQRDSGSTAGGASCMAGSKTDSPSKRRGTNCALNSNRKYLKKQIESMHRRFI